MVGEWKLKYRVRKLKKMALRSRSIGAFGMLVISLIGCDSTPVQYDIPEPFVDQTIYLSDPSSFNLTVVGGQLHLPNVGNGGILVYRRFFDNSFYDFAAYELSCPEHWMENCGTMSSTMGDLYITCDCDGGHQYQLLDGQSLDTNYILPVKEFRCQFDGGNIIRITN